MEDHENKGKILNGAKELFKRFGVRSITMDDIAHHLGISKKTIYQYFADKDDIVTLAMKNFIEQERSVFERVKKESKDAIDQLFRLTQCMRQNMKDTNTSLLFDLQKYHPKAWSLFLEFKHSFLKDHIKADLRNGIDEGFYREDIPIDILATMRLEVVTTLAHDEQIFPRDKYNIIDLQHVLFDHFISGILTDKGRKVYDKYKNEYQASNPSA
jgi:TetR/AcrR family transcriptional regulator, cholesterol catabolism regulator